MVESIWLNLFNDPVILLSTGVQRSHFPQDTQQVAGGGATRGHARLIQSKGGKQPGSPRQQLPEKAADESCPTQLELNICPLGLSYYSCKMGFLSHKVMK